MYKVAVVNCCRGALLLPLAFVASATDADYASVLQVHLQVSNTETGIHGGVASANQARKLPTFAVLLTTYNTRDRELMYTKRLHWWLNKTMLPIYVVDSSGHGFSPSFSNIRSFKQVQFNQTRFLKGNWGSTEAELLSLKQAWEAFQDDWSKLDYVVKVTGKYVLPGLQSEMKKIHTGNSFIIQQSTDHPESGHLRWVNTECLGFNAARMGELLEMLATDKRAAALEEKLGQSLMTGRYPMQQLESMQIPYEYWTERGSGDTLYSVLQTSQRGAVHTNTQALKRTL